MYTDSPYKGIFEGSRYTSAYVIIIPDKQFPCVIIVV